MVSVFGFSFDLPPALTFLSPNFVSFILTLLVWFLVALIIYITLTYILRAFTRQLPGDVEDILLGIFRRPLILLILAYGVLNSMEILPMPQTAIDFVRKVFITILIFVVLNLIYRLIRDVLVYYGRGWARRTESKIDDNLVAMLNLFGPLIIVIVGVLLILQLWGYNITSVLVGAGVIGLILGLALQDSLSNLFSGMSLVVEAAFQVGDLLILSDGSVCEVEELGLRSTKLYSLQQHSTVHMPNNLLANNQIVNITKPTVEQRSTIDISIPMGVDFAQVEEEVERIACGQPGVLMKDLGLKIDLVEKRLGELQAEVERAIGNEPLHQRLRAEMPRFEFAAAKLRREKIMNDNLASLREQLITLAREIAARERQGIAKEEQQALWHQFIIPLEQTVNATVDSTRAWCLVQDGWAFPDEIERVERVYDSRIERLVNHWEDLKNAIGHPSDREELRLDDRCNEMADWVRSSFKILPESWKDPRVTFKGFAGESARLQLSFYVDNIRLEHDLRLERITTDIAREIRSRGIA
jgi:small-conductance mechanosensitive channel